MNINLTQQDLENELQYIVKRQMDAVLRYSEYSLLFDNNGEPETIECFGYFIRVNVESVTDQLIKGKVFDILGCATYNFTLDENTFTYNFTGAYQPQMDEFLVKRNDT